jgi:peptidoglycan/xylan/chitin deacetylase (PgdA/CDA1 family)
MRLDRFITLNLMRPLRRMTHHESRITSLPILMYHSISDEPEPGVPAYYQTNTSPAVFRRHMQFLADQGYRTINLDQLVSWLTKGGEVSAFQHFSFSALPKPVVLTFDDGFRDFFTEAFPILQNHGYTATMFLPTAFIRDSSSSSIRANSPFRNSQSAFLSWTEIIELRQAGIQFGSHTVNHPKLVELSWSGIQSELSNSKSDIEQHLGEPVSAFCYPFAFPQTDRSFAHTFRDLVVQTGYSCCTTTELGRVHPGSDPFRLKRLPANALDDNALLAAKLEGAYDWMAAPQSAVKTIKAFLRPQPSARKAIPAAGAPSNPSRLVGSAEQ